MPERLMFESRMPVRSALFKSRGRQKLIHSSIYFKQHTKFCNTVKLFKLLNFLDFEHFRQTGLSVTGQLYKAWKQGPVPEQFWRELKHPSADLEKSIQIVERRDELSDELTRRDFNPRVSFNARLFSKRELQIMEQLAFVFSELTASQISAFSHEKRLPWARVFKEGRNNEIPYRLTLDSAPIFPKMPSIKAAELAYLQESFKQVDADKSD